MNNISHFQLLQYLGATVMFLYLSRYCVRAIQLYGFVRLLQKQIELSAKDNKKDKIIQFNIPIEELIKGFGYNVNEEFIMLSATTPNTKSTYVIFIGGVIVLASLIAYFLFGISIKLIFFAVISLLFLLLIF